MSTASQPLVVPRAGIASLLRDYATLTKARVTTLIVMTIATAVFLPIVLAYTTWVYRVLRGPVTERDIGRDPKTAY